MRRPWWKASRTRTQARNGGIVWLVLAVIWWASVLVGTGGWWGWPAALAATGMSILNLVTWRRWRSDRDGAWATDRGR